MWDLVPQSVRNFIDAIFSPPLSFLNLMKDMILNAGTVVGKGIDLNNYFGFFSYLPSEWRLVVNSALLSIGLIAVLLLVRAAWDMYLRVKGSLKWW